MNVTITTDRDRIDFDRVSRFIMDSYWGQGRSDEAIRRSFDNSVCFSAFQDDRQVGFARVATDFAFHAYIFDLFVFEEFRGRGIANVLMEAILAEPQLRAVTGFMLSTRDAHGLYRKFGFETVADKNRYMVRKFSGNT